MIPQGVNQQQHKRAWTRSPKGQISYPHLQPRRQKKNKGVQILQSYKAPQETERTPYPAPRDDRPQSAEASRPNVKRAVRKRIRTLTHKIRKRTTRGLRHQSTGRVAPSQPLGHHGQHSGTRVNVRLTLTSLRQAAGRTTEPQGTTKPGSVPSQGTRSQFRTLHAASL